MERFGGRLESVWSENLQQNTGFGGLVECCLLSWKLVWRQLFHLGASDFEMFCLQQLQFRYDIHAKITVNALLEYIYIYIYIYIT